MSHDTTFGYDNHGRRTTVTNHVGKTTTTGYDNWNRVTSVTTPDPDGAGSQTASVTSYAYDRRNLVTSITDPRDGVTAFTYDTLGQLTNLRDASNNDTAWTYDGLGRVTAETNELNKTRSYAHDAASNLIRQTDRNGRTTRFTYDNLDRLTEEKWIAGGTVPTATAVTDTQGGPHDEVQRVGHQNAYTGTFTLTFDGQTTSAIAFDATAATVKTALENLSNIDSGDITVTKTQNSAGNHEWQIVFRGSKSGTNVAQITINTAGLFPSPTATQTTDTQGSASNAEVQTVTLNNATGGTFRLTFESAAYGQEQTADLAYNATASTVETALDGLAGIDNVAVSGSAGGPYTITFGGTQSNTNVAQISADVTFLTSGTVDRTFSYAYDAASQLTSTSDPDSSYAYTYDNLGRVLTVSNSGTSGVPTVVLTSAYNANSQRTSLSATRGGTNDFLNSYTYDNLGRLTRLDQTGNGGATVANKRVDFTYNALGQFATIARQVKPSSTWDEVATSTYTYDTLNRLTALDHKKGSTDIANYDWTYDATNRVTSVTSGDGTSSYTYDKEGQLTGVDHSYQTDESFTYDATGNRTNSGYSTGTANRLTSDGVYNYTYDDEGNRLTRTKISNGHLTEYTWDHRNRLMKVVERAGGAGQAITKQSDYKYDVFNNRISKSVDADGAGGGSAVVTRYDYDGNRLAFTLDGSNSVTGRYVYGPAVDQILASEDGSNAVWVPLTDNLGSVRDILNSSGSVQNHITYDSFGSINSETNAAIDFIMGYAGSFFDGETGLNYHGGTYVDSTNAQLTTQSTYGSVYVGNSPTNYTMPSSGFIIPANPGGYPAMQPYDPIALGLVHPQPVEPGPPVSAYGSQGFVMTAGGLGSAAAWLDLPEASSIQQSAAFGIGQVAPLAPQLNVHHEWDNTQHFANQLVGIADNVPLSMLTPFGMLLIPFGIDVHASDIVNYFYPNYIDTHSADYVFLYGVGMLYMSMGEAKAMEMALARAARAGTTAARFSGASRPPRLPDAPHFNPPDGPDGHSYFRGSRPMDGGCFVAGTPVLMAPEPAISEAIGAAESEPGVVPRAWIVAFAGLGLAALAVDVRLKKRKRAAAESCTLDGTSGEDPAAQDDFGDDAAETATHRLFADSTWVADALKLLDFSDSSRPASAIAKVAVRTLIATRPSRSSIPWLKGVAAALLAAAVLLGFFSSPTHERPVAGPPKKTIAMASTAETAPPTFQAIETIEVGQRVLGENPTGEFDDSLGREVDPATWRKLTLRAPKRDGTFADVVLLRPNWWIAERGAEVGGTVLISVPECGIDGNAQVLAIDPCPPITLGPGNVVIGTFHHQSAQVLDLYLEGEAEPVGTTANHPFWSVDRQSFVRADELHCGELLLASGGPIGVWRVDRKSTPQGVSNIEVLGQHVYRVHYDALLVHNAPGQGDCPWLTLPNGTRVDDKILQIEPKRAGTRGRPDHRVGAHQVVPSNAFARSWSSQPADFLRQRILGGYFSPWCLSRC